MKVAMILLALAAAVAAESYSHGYKHYVDYYAPAHYKFDWAVKDDYYNDYGQYEARDGYHTRGNWWVMLPGKSHIKTDYDVNSHVYHGYANKGYAALH